VLTEGIGRLYLERRPTHGRVLWSKDGVVQAALTDLSSEQIQSIVNELKRLTHLPLLPTTQPKQPISNAFTRAIACCCACA
jgi:hypothetical protein